jgi:glucose/arabinose dehydrogenase
MQKILSAVTIAVACSVSVAAQWPKHEDTSVPRDAQGRPRLDAPPQFATNRLMYLAYSKPGPGVGDATTAVYRARWDGGATLADGRDIFIAKSSQAPAGRAIGPASGSYGARIAWDKDGLPDQRRAADVQGGGSRLEGDSRGSAAMDDT